MKAYSDIVIIGGGLTGSVLACALGQSKLFSKITVLDGAPTPSAPASPAPDPRVLTISPVSQNFLKDVGAWDLLDASRIGEFHGMKVWDTTLLEQ